MWWPAVALLVLVLVEVYWALWLLAWRVVPGWVRAVPPVLVLSAGTSAMLSVLRSRAAFTDSAAADASMKSSILSDGLASAFDPLIYCYALVLAAAVALAYALFTGKRPVAVDEE